MSLRQMIETIRYSQSGNVFFALFGAVALVGVVGASSMQIMKGPVRSMSEVTKRTVAENNMIASAKLALIAATSQSDSGDCDADGYVEPVPFEASATGAPIGGGFLPAAIGAALNDPWDTRYGYCSWDHGAITAACGGSNFLAGENAATGYAIALISAGPDRQFQTTCNAYPSAAALDKTPGTDDIVLGYTYGEASALAGGLWNLKSGDAETAEINRNLEVRDESGNVTFALDAQSGLGDFIGLTTGSIAGKNGPLDVTGGLKFESDSIALNAACTQEDAFAFDTATDMLVRCDGSIWVPSGGSDNLGNHEATENIQLKGFWLSNDGGDEGLQVSDDGVLTTSGDVTVGNDLTTTAAATVGTTLDVTGNSTLATVSTSGLATLNSASVTQNAGIGGTLDVTGGTTLTSLTTSGAAQINSATIDTTLGVTGATSLSTLSTSGLSSLNALSVTNNAAVGGTLDMTSGKIANLLDPTLAQDAASKAYVDARVASGTGFTEADPQVGTIQSSKWCVGNNDGSAIVCDQNMPVPDDTLAGLSCSTGQVPKWNGTVWACAADNAGGGSSATGKGLLVAGSTTSLPNGVATNLAFTTLSLNDFDSGAWASNAFIVPTGEAGWYSIAGHITLPNTSQHAIVYITVNGANVALSRDVSNTASNVIQYVNASAVVFLNEGDIVRMQASQAGGSTIALTGGRLALAKMGGGGTGVADNLGDHIATQSVRLFKATGSAGTIVPATGDNLGDHIATTNIQIGTNWLSADGSSEGISVLSGGRLRSDYAGSTYDVFVQGGSGNSGVTRRLALLGTEVGMLYLNYGSEYASGTTIGGPVTFTSTLAGNGSGLTTLNASNLASGLVPTARLGTGTANSSTYLRGDGTWATTPSGADNLGDHIATQTLRSDAHNIDDLGTTAIRWKDGWFQGTVTAATGFSGPGTFLSALNAANLATGIVPTARLGTGTASATTYLRGDGTWAPTPSAADNLGNHIATQVLRSDTHNTDDLGTTAIRWKDGWFHGTVTAATGFSGPGTSLTALNATNLSSGTVAAARMPALTGDVTMTAGTTVTALSANSVTTTEIAADTVVAADIAASAITSSELANSAVTIAKLAATGTPSATTFLRGDNTWAVPAPAAPTCVKRTGSSGSGSSVTCQTGETLTGGGCQANSGSITMSRPNNAAAGWECDGSGSQVPHAICCSF